MNIQQYQMQSRNGGLMGRANDGSYTVGGSAYLGPAPSDRPRPGMRIMPGQPGQFVPAAYQAPTGQPTSQPMGPTAGGGMTPYQLYSPGMASTPAAGAAMRPMPRAMRYRRRQTPMLDPMGNMPGEWDYQMPTQQQLPPMVPYSF